MGRKAKLDHQGRKLCLKCGDYKALEKDHFYFHSDGTPFSYCRLCNNRISAENFRRRKAKKEGVEFKPRFDDQNRKICTRCQEFKPLDDEHFYFHSRKKGFSSRCRPCVSLAANENRGSALVDDLSDAKVFRLYRNSLITTPELYFRMKKGHGDMAVFIMNRERERFGLPPIDKLEVRRWDRSSENSTMTSPALR